MPVYKLFANLPLNVFHYKLFLIVNQAGGGGAVIQGIWEESVQESVAFCVCLQYNHTKYYNIFM